MAPQPDIWFRLEQRFELNVSDAEHVGGFQPLQSISDTAILPPDTLLVAAVEWVRPRLVDPRNHSIAADLTFKHHDYGHPFGKVRFDPCKDLLDIGVEVPRRLLNFYPSVLFRKMPPRHFRSANANLGAMLLVKVSTAVPNLFQRQAGSI